MNRKVIIAVVLILVIGAGIALIRNSSKNTETNTPSQSSSSSSSAKSNQPASTGTINIKNMIFSPSQISIQKGGTVTWTNNDTTAHTVIDDLSNVGGPASGNIEPGSSYSFTFNKTGSFQYHCSIHPSMRGTIVVN